MAGPIAATGAISNPTRYGALEMAGEQFTGLWTQAGPYRDAATAYLIRKFYQGNRFDRIFDGLNREITSDLTDGRRPGSAIYNSNACPPVNSYFSWKFIQNGLEQIRVLADCTDGTIRDVTAGQLSTLATKTVGASPARFMNISQELFVGDGIDQKKVMTGRITWSSAKAIAPGTLIATGSAPGTMQMALGGISMTVVATASDGAGKITVWIDPQNVPLQFTNLEGVLVSFSGLTIASALNGNTYPVSIVSTTLGILTVSLALPVYAETADTGAGSTGSGVTGVLSPSFSIVQYGITADAGQQWKCYGSALQNWGLVTPPTAPAVSPQNGSRYWQPNATLPFQYTLLDSNQNVELITLSSRINVVTIQVFSKQRGGTGPFYFVLMATLASPLPSPSGNVFFEGLTNYPAVNGQKLNFVSGPLYGLFPSANQFCVLFGSALYGPTADTGDVGSGGITGRSYPKWSIPTTANPNPQTIDGSAVWENLGIPSKWGPSAVFASLEVILDSNFNLQYVTAGGGGSSGASEPSAWSATIGGTTVDGALTWTCLGPGVAFTTDTLKYSFSLHAIDGSISTASPATVIQGPILGMATMNQTIPFPILSFTASWTGDSQIDQIYMYRTPQGQSIQIFEDAVPIDHFPTGGQFYGELGVTDTSTDGAGALSIFIQAPVSHLNDPPPAGLTGPVYHLQRTWGFVGNSLYYSAGPDTIATTSNGNTAWPPLNRIAFQAGIIKLLPITVQNGGLLVFTTSGIFIVLGTGTASNPFYATQYCDKVNLASYTTLDVVGTEIYMMEANAKVSSLVVEYPFNPQSGYTEVGFPIGDQFRKVTTGGITAVLYNPATSYLSWNVQCSGETAMYVADGATGWFRMAQVSPPETGLLWNPRAAIAGGTSAVQSVETAPGIFDLLIGPSGGGGPILKRDTSDAVRDDNGVAFASWDVKGVNRLCSTGQWAEVAHIATKSKAVGARPIVSVLMGEIAASTERPWNVLEVTSPDPPLTRRSQSVYSDRYSLAQNGVDDTGDCILTRFDYGLQAVGDELYDWGIFASTEEERKEEVQKG